VIVGPTAADLEPLEVKALLCLQDGDETTLLVLQLVNDPDTVGPLFGKPPITEDELRGALGVLQARGLVRSYLTPGPGVKEVGTGLPEHEEARSVVIWWSLTPPGRGVAASSTGAKGP
jgi:hypothetical protein